MRWVVPYKPWFGSVLPLVPVEVPRAGILYAFVDSGATVSLFDVSVAKTLGIHVESGVRHDLLGAGGRIRAFRHAVPVRVMDQPITLNVCFSHEYVPSVNLLGRDNFFMHFLVTFDEVGRRTILETREGSLSAFG